MLSMDSLGLSITAAEYLAGFEELPWFLNEVAQRKKVKRYRETLELAETIRMAVQSSSTNRGANAYNRWTGRIRRKIDAELTGVEEMTVFDRLKANRPKAVTVFDKLRRN